MQLQLPMQKNTTRDRRQTKAAKGFLVFFRKVSFLRFVVLQSTSNRQDMQQDKFRALLCLAAVVHGVAGAPRGGRAASTLESPPVTPGLGVVHADSAAADSAPPGSTLWRFPAGPGSSGPPEPGLSGCQTYYGIDFAAAVLRNGTAYFTSEAAGWRVFAVDAATGRALWNVSLSADGADGGEVATSTAPTVADTGVYIAVVLKASQPDTANVNNVNADGKAEAADEHPQGGSVELRCLDLATGAVRWRARAEGSYVYGAPTVMDDLVLAVLDKGVTAVAEADGAPRWTAAKPGCSETSPTAGGPGVVLVAGGAGGGVVALNSKTGAVLWESPPGTSSPWATPVVADAGNGGTPTIFSSGFIDKGPVEQYNTGVVYALSSATGKVRWATNLTKFDQYAYAPLAPAVVDGTVFVAGAMPSLFALDAATGAVAWQATNLCSGHLWAAPAVANGVVYVGCDSGTLFAMDAKSGKKVWSAVVGKNGGSARSPVVADGRVLVGVTPLRGGDGPDALVALVA